MINEQTTKDWIPLAEGVRRKTIAIGDKMMQVAVWLRKGAKLPEHAHVHEQLATVVSGKLRFIIAGQPRELSAGESVALKSNVPHGVEAMEETVVLDTFSPLREDLLKADAEHSNRQGGV